MLVRGDVKCLHCGYVSGTWVGVAGTPLRRAGFTSDAGAPVDAVPDPLRCLRCGGPVYLESAAPVLSPSRLRRIRQLREQLDALDLRRKRRSAA